MSKSWRSEKTPAKIAYWESLKGKRGIETPRWKGNESSKSAFHQWLHKNFGHPDHCKNPECEGKSKLFEWCLKTGKVYTHNPDDYIWLCRKCHRKYDFTPSKKIQAVKNLWWVRGLKNPNAKQ